MSRIAFFLVVREEMKKKKKKKKRRRSQVWNLSMGMDTSMGVWKSRFGLESLDT